MYFLFHYSNILLFISYWFEAFRMGIEQNFLYNVIDWETSSKYLKFKIFTCLYQKIVTRLHKEETNSKLIITGSCYKCLQELNGKIIFSGSLNYKSIKGSAFKEADAAPYYYFLTRNTLFTSESLFADDVNLYAPCGLSSGKSSSQKMNR